MKLHLPKKLVAALVACYSILSPVTTVLSTTTLVGGVAFVLSQEQLSARIFNWTGTTSTAADIATNWTVSSAATFPNPDPDEALFDWDGAGDAGIINSGEGRNIIHVTTASVRNQININFDTVALGGIFAAGLSGDGSAHELIPTSSRSMIWRGSLDDDATAIGGIAGLTNFNIDADFKIGTSSARWVNWEYQSGSFFNIEEGATLEVFAQQMNVSGTLPSANYVHTVQGKGTLKLDLSSSYDLSRTADWTIQGEGTIELTSLADGDTALFSTLSLVDGSLNLGTTGNKTLTSQMIIGAGGGTLIGTGVTLTGSIRHTDITANSLTLNGSFTLGALSIDLGITGDIANGDYTLFSRTADTDGFAETDLDVLKSQLSILNVDASRYGDLRWADDNLILTLQDSAARELFLETGDITWAVGGDTAWELADGTPVAFALGDTVTIGAADSIGGQLTVNGTINPASITVTGGGDWVITGSGSIAGTSALVKNNTGSLTIATSNTYQGGTTLTTGSLILNAESAIGSGVLSMSGATTVLEIGHANAVAGASILYTDGLIKYASGITTSLHDKITLAADAVLKLDLNGNSITWSAAIAGNFNLSNSSATASVFTYASNVSGRTVDLGAGVEMRSSFSNANGINLTGTGTLTITGNTASYYLFATAGFTGTVNALNGGQITFLNRDNTAADRFMLNSSATTASNAQALVMGSNQWSTGDTLYLKGLSGYSNISVANGTPTNRGLDILMTEDNSYHGNFYAANASDNRWGTVTIGGDFTFNWTGMTTRAGTNYTSVGTNAKLLIKTGSTMNFALNDDGDDGGEWADDISIESGGKLLISRSDTTGFVQFASGNVISGEGKVEVSGNASLTGDNTYTGGTDVTGSGTLNVLSAQALSTGAITVSDAATLVASTGLTISAGQSVSNSGAMELNQRLTINNTVANATTGSITLGADTVFDLSDTPTEVLGALTTYKVFDNTAGGDLDFTALTLDGILDPTTMIVLNGDFVDAVAGVIWRINDNGTITSGPQGVLTWDGTSGIGSVGTGGNGSWSTSNIWNNSFGADSTFAQNDSVLFDKGTGNVNVDIVVATPSMTVTGSGVNYTFSGNTITIADELSVEAGGTASFDNQVVLGTATVSVDDTGVLIFRQTEDLTINELANTGQVTTSADLTVNTPITDGGSLSVTGSLILAGDAPVTNTFEKLIVTGNVSTSSILKLGTDSSIGGSLSGRDLIITGNTSINSITSALNDVTIEAGTLTIEGVVTIAGEFENFDTLDVKDELMFNASTTTGGIIKSLDTLTFADSTASRVEALELGADMVLASALTIETSLTAPSNFTATANYTPTTATGFIRTDSVAGATVFDFIIADALLDDITLADGAQLILLNIVTSSTLTRATINSADFETVGSFRYTIDFDGINVILIAELLGNQWISTDEQWSSVGSWDLGLPSELQSAIFQGNGTQNVTLTESSTANEVIISIKDGSTQSSYHFTGSELTTGKLSVLKGELLVNNEINIVDTFTTTPSPRGSLSVGRDGTLTVGATGSIHALTAQIDALGTLAINEGGSLTVTGALEAADSTLINEGELSVGDGTVIDTIADTTETGKLLVGANATASITGSLGNKNVDLAAGSTLNLAQTTTLSAMTGTGTLQLEDGKGLIIEANSSGVVGGVLRATELVLGNAAQAHFDALSLSHLYLQGELRTTGSRLSAGALTPLSGSTIELVIDPGVIFSWSAAAGGAATTYFVYEQAGASWTNFTFTDQTKSEINGHVLNGVDVLLTTTGNALTFTIQESTDRTWFTSNNYAATPQEDNSLSRIDPIFDTTTGKIVSYDVLDTVRQVFVDQSFTIDLVGVDNTTGNMGLNVSNLRGNAGLELEILGDGITEDTVILNNTELTFAQNDIVAQGVTLKVDTIGTDARLETGALKLDAALLDASAAGSNIVVASLSDVTGTGAEIKGTVSVNGAGGVYTGNYDGATINAMAGANQSLIAGAGLSLTGAAGSLLITDAAGGQLDGINTTGAHVTLDLTGASTATEGLTLGSASNIQGGSLTLVFNSDLVREGQTVTALSGSSLTLDADSQLILSLGDVTDFTLSGLGTQNIELFELSPDSVINGEIVLDATLSRFFENVQYDSATHTIIVDINTAAYTALATTNNGAAGLGLLSNALVDLGSQIEGTTPEFGDLAGVLDDLNNYLTSGDRAGADALGAAVAGSTVTSLGSSMLNAVENQLQSVRNRSESMRINDFRVAGDSSFQAWISAEGSSSTLDHDGTASGHDYDSWGGSLGLSTNLTESTTLGLSLSALYGRVTSDVADQASGDLNTYGLAAYLVMLDKNWTHSLIATASLADAQLDRTVSYSGGSYTSRGDTDGYGLGLMYELAYTMNSADDASTIWQPIFNIALVHGTINGYNETGSDASLRVGDQNSTYVTFGLGGRVQTSFGEDTFNRSATFSARALAKLDVGSRYTEADVALVNNAGVTNRIEGAEPGAVGVELGAGLNIPVGNGSGSIFVDAGVELRSSMNDVSGSVGYQLRF